MVLGSLYSKFISALKSFGETYISSLFEIRSHAPIHVYRKPQHYGRPVLEILFKRRTY